ncbi:hypothetical protein KI387_020057 [Taxus chinensis]|uniref:DUF3700 domain-containing protein n=1 Tax=Taxus chinensis TaxID=29808 RepID=A0AA38LB82_TAXCH|nr:hypothetical protein KI387_020057 [Taxus chinensis]
MLAVFKRSVAEAPAELMSPQVEERERKNGVQLMDSFVSAHSGAVCVKLGDAGAMAYDQNHHPFLTPRQALFSFTSEDIVLRSMFFYVKYLGFSYFPLVCRVFAVVEDIFCVFEGALDNIVTLRQQYGLSKCVNANEVTIVIEAYRTLKDRGPYPADQVVRDLSGKFAFLLFDSKFQTLFTAADADGSMPFFWGTTADGCLVLSDEVGLVKEGCRKSFAPFPRGCFFSTPGGLQSFEHPRNKLMPLPRIDSEGQMCGANFKVDEFTKKGSAIPRVGSEANWANKF